MSVSVKSSYNGGDAAPKVTFLIMFQLLLLSDLSAINSQIKGMSSANPGLLALMSRIYSVRKMNKYRAFTSRI